VAREAGLASSLQSIRTLLDRQSDDDRDVLGKLFGEATLALLASHTPAPVETYDLSPAPVVPRTGPATARANGITLEYDTFGDPADPPLLLVMGLAGQMVAWDEAFCARIAARGYHVVRFDNRDIGRSTWLDHEPVPSLVSLMRAQRKGLPMRVPYLVDDMADDAVGLLDALGIGSAHVVGISMGGMIAQTMAARAPGRVRTLTSIMSHTGDRDLPHPHWRAMAMLFVPAVRDREAYQRRAVMVWRVLNGPKLAVDAARTRAAAALAFDRGIHPAGAGRQMAAIVASGSRTEALRTLAIPALVLHGDQDPLVPLEGGRRTAAAIPGAVLEIIPGMGHALPPPLWERIIDRITAHAVYNGTPHAEEAGEAGMTPCFPRDRRTRE
jgi:pimeloyl-ACP methyl ester carboxylesterase